MGVRNQCVRWKQKRQVRKWKERRKREEEEENKGGRVAEASWTQMVSRVAGTVSSMPSVTINLWPAHKAAVLRSPDCESKQRGIWSAWQMTAACLTIPFSHQCYFCPLFSSQHGLPSDEGLLYLVDPVVARHNIHWDGRQFPPAAGHQAACGPD